jgi:hypothetical protein
VTAPILRVGEPALASSSQLVPKLPQNGSIKPGVVSILVGSALPHQRAILAVSTLIPAMGTHKKV